MVPAYNEARCIGETLKELIAAGYSSIVVVDDGSSDDTAERAEQYAVVVRHAANRGMGAALATGTQWALAQGAEYIIHFDADGQHDPKDIAALIGPLKEGRADIVLGSRYRGSSNVPWTKRYFIHGPARALQNLLTGIRLTDVHNGLRAMTRQTAGRITITQDRMAHNTEIVAQIAQYKLRYCEVPVTIRYREYGQGLGGGIAIVKDLFIRWLVR